MNRILQGESAVKILVGVYRDHDIVALVSSGIKTATGFLRARCWATGE